MANNKVMVNFRVIPHLRDEAKVMAYQQGKSLSTWLTEAIRYKLALDRGDMANNGDMPSPNSGIALNSKKTKTGG